MPYVKQISIHKSPLSMLEYILDENKNADMKYASGLNCDANTISAYSAFKQSFEYYSKENFYKYTADKQKDRVRIHHYVQSFDPNENVNPEEAHKIGLEWAKKTFGENRQVICSTHIDRGHIHNHFAVAPFALNGSVWHSNKKTLQQARKISDEISIEHGISIIENVDRNKRAMGCSEWEATKQGVSWKDNLRQKIDRLIVDDKVSCLDDLLTKLAEENYKIRRGKYITITPPDQERGVRTFRLGSGYSEENLQHRIENKDKECSIPSIAKNYKGIQVEYALIYRQIQLCVYKKQPNPKRFNYDTLKKTADMLNFISNNNIHSKQDWENIIQSKLDEVNGKQSECNNLKKKCDDMKKLYNDSAIYFEISKKLPNITEDERKEFLRTEYCLDRDINSENDLADLETEIANLEEDYHTHYTLLQALKDDSKTASFLYQKYSEQVDTTYTALLEKARNEKELFEQTQAELEQEQEHVQQQQEYDNQNQNYDYR